MVGPPDLVVGGGDDLAGNLVRDRAPQRGVQMRCSAFLRFHGREVLHLPAQDATQVLHQAVHQRGEVDRISRGTPVVVGSRVHGCAVTDRAVAVAGERQKHRRPVLPGVFAPDRSLADLPSGQVRERPGVVGWNAYAQFWPAHPVDGIRPRNPDARRSSSAAWISSRDSSAAVSSPASHAARYATIRSARWASNSVCNSLGGVRLRDGFVVEVPALAELLHSQQPRLFRARGALGFRRRFAWHSHVVGGPCVEVEDPHHQRPHTDTVLFCSRDGDVMERGSGATLGSRLPATRRLHRLIGYRR